MTSSSFLKVSRIGLTMQCYGLPEGLEVGLHRRARLRWWISSTRGHHGQPGVGPAAPVWWCFAAQKADEILPANGSPALFHPGQHVLKSNARVLCKPNAVRSRYREVPSKMQRGEWRPTLLRRWWPIWMPRSKLLWWASTLSVMVGDNVEITIANNHVFQIKC